MLVHEGGYNVARLPQLVRSVLGGLGDFETDDTDVFVPEDAPAPREWNATVQEVLKVQNRYWAELT